MPRTKKSTEPKIEVKDSSTIDNENEKVITNEESIPDIEQELNQDDNDDTDDTELEIIENVVEEIEEINNIDNKVILRELNDKPKKEKENLFNEYYWLDAIEQGIRTRQLAIDEVIPIEDMLDSDTFDCILYFSLYSPRTSYIIVHYDYLYVQYFIDRLLNNLSLNTAQQRIKFINDILNLETKIESKKMKNKLQDIPDDVLFELIKQNKNIVEKIKSIE